MAAGGAKSSDVQKEEDRLQAIVLADSFTGTFRPCSLDRPKVLLPLLNVPMLDYVMEFLVSSGVQEVFIFCVNKREVVQEYVARSKWPSSVALRCISSAKCMGAGDALREMDGLGLIRSNPFVIISGDVVSTVNLPAVIAAHKRRKAENSLNILTVVLSKVGYEAGVHPREEDLVVGLDKGTEQLLVYEDDAEDSRLEVALALLKEEGHPELRLRNDLMDTHIYVCSPEVLVAFSDNWDYQDLGRYLRNEVQNREMGNRLFAHVTGPHEYAVRVHDPHVYHAVSLDLLHRWLYPNVPENNNNIHSGSEHTTYRYRKRWLYKEAGDGTAEGGVHVSRSAAISKSVMLGQGTSIGPGSELSTSVLGRRVRVGANVTIRDSHIWNDVVIEDGAVIESSVLADEVMVRAGARVGRGSMLSYGVVLGAGVDLPPFSRLTATPASSWGHDGGSSSSHSHFHSFEGAYSPSSASPFASSPRSFGNRTPGGMMTGEAEALTDPTVVGPDGVGRAWAPLFDGERISEAELRMQSIGAVEEDEARRQRWAQLEEEEYDEEEQTPLQGSAEGLSLTTAGPYHPDTAGAGPAAVAVAPGSTTTDAYFAHVVHDMVVSGYASRHPVANILLEVKSFKFAHNRTFAAVVSAAVPALLDLALDPDVVFRQAADDDEEGPRRGTEGAAGASPAVSTAVVLPDKAALANIEAQLEYWDALLRALNQEPEVEAAVLAATEEYALQEGPDGALLPNAQSLHNVFGLVLVSYVNAEVMHKEAALAWVEQHEAAAAAGEVGGSSSSLQHRAHALFQTPRTQKFVAWIRAYESESEEEEEESSSDDDNDDESSEEED